MKRVVYKTHSFAEADKRDIRQQLAMTHQERLRAARILKDRVYQKDSKDVRECLKKA